ncbi:FecR family protein [Dyadobacter sandarakinus]|uniref:FecR family protein n=1 Tax=Dyadobacter sandarakinus TaxID=2747268 RepID=A0ABX7I1S0_9BACT|nr:FecR family protein [Dyadobacter sandarakinus]QRR00026.1 FecR family protein [Dyadobacter sandarakinus]
MKDYVSFQPEEFAQDDFFIHWVKSTDYHAETFWQNWLETYPFKRNDVEVARQLVLLTQHLPGQEFSKSEIQDLKTSIFQKIASLENSGSPVRPLRSYPYWIAAAVLAGLMFMAGWYFLQNETIKRARYASMVKEAAHRYDLLEVKNHTKATRLVNLPDGSSVILKKGSKLSYPSYFAQDKREVFLTGEAFFEIAKDADKPFYVFANEIATKVVGTSFTIKSYPRDKQIVVTVKTGKVSIFNPESPEEIQQRNKKSEGLILTPDQQAVFEKEDLLLIRKIVTPKDPALMQQAEYMLFEYEESPLEKVFEDLENAYQIKIVFDKITLGKSPITASLTDEPLEEKLKLICKAIRADYQKVNGEVIISEKEK